MINGIDVSHHNDIDWNKIQTLNLTQNLYFAFIKVSEGTGNLDKKFQINRPGSTDAGLLCSGYHFFLPMDDPIHQADIFSAQIGSLQPGEIPPVVDIEWTLIKDKKGAVKRTEQWKSITPSARISVISDFLKQSEKRLGIKPIIYTAAAFWNDFIASPNHPSDLALFIDYPLWIVNIKGALTIPRPWSKATFVQNGFGELAPKNASAFEKLDHDFFNGTLRGLLALAAEGKVFERGAPTSAFVRDFQQRLKNLGFYGKVLDGDFGRNTEQAVMDFQDSVGLTRTGRIDETTWKLLL